MREWWTHQIIAGRAEYSELAYTLAESTGRGSRRLFIVQRFDRIHPRGFICRVEAEEDTYHHGEQEGNGNGLRGDDRGPADEVGQEAGACDAEQDADDTADPGQNDRLH